MKVGNLRGARKDRRQGAVADPVIQKTAWSYRQGEIFYNLRL